MDLPQSDCVNSLCGVQARGQRSCHGERTFQNSKFLLEACSVSCLTLPLERCSTVFTMPWPHRRPRGRRKSLTSTFKQCHDHKSMICATLSCADLRPFRLAYSCAVREEIVRYLVGNVPEHAGTHLDSASCHMPPQPSKFRIDSNQSEKQPVHLGTKVETVAYRLLAR